MGIEWLYGFLVGYVLGGIMVFIGFVKSFGFKKLFMVRI